MLIEDAHPGYITFAQYERNQATLASNAAARGQERRAGPAREGPALLQGLVICGTCGKRMTVNYHKRCNGELVPDYACQREGIATGTPPCQTICGHGIDLAALVLDQLTPLASETALHVSAELAKRASDADRIRATSVERARYAADAARRYLAVDPANRLVADQLEADWNHELRELGDAQDEYERAQNVGASTLTDEQQARIRALASDLPALSGDPATPMRERKRLIRLLITDVTLIKAGEQITAHVRLSGGQLHTLTVPRPLRAWEAHTTPPATIALIDQLLDDHTYDETVNVLNQQGLTGGWGYHSPSPRSPSCAATAASLPSRAAPSPGHAHARRDRRAARRQHPDDQDLAAPRAHHRPTHRRSPPTSTTPASAAPRTVGDARQPNPSRHQS